ncbi:MAG: response regulator transcription factor [Pseudomonadales bacterium]|nr:response regulator transcription factor [Pseudomonadales bacterium]
MRILLAEDDLETAAVIRLRLGELGHEVLHADNGERALQLALSEHPEVLVLDRMLPGLDGLTILRRLRGEGIDAPALMLTALGRIEDRVEGLDAGADDYLVKPFAFSELAARINALFRRRGDTTETHLSVATLNLDLLSRRVEREGREIVLQPREFRLLEELVRHAGKVVTRTMLLEKVWDFHFDPQTNIVETHMSRMRAKLNQGFASDLIETVRGEGYRMRNDA